MYEEPIEEQPLPQNFVAEQGILGGILYDPPAISLVADKLTAKDFLYASNRHPDIWQAMLWLYEHEQPIDLTSLYTRLERMGITEIRERNTLVYLNSLWNFALKNGPHVEADAKLVRDVSLRRQIHGAIAEMAAITQREDNAETALEKCEAVLYQINAGIEQNDLTPLADAMQEFVLDLDVRQRARGRIVGIPTGLDDLDMLTGGLQRKELIVVGGKPGDGKTSLILNILYHLLMVNSHMEEHKRNVAFFSLEMSKIDLCRRLISMDTGIDSQFLRTRFIQDEQWDIILSAAENKLASHQIYVDESGDLTPATMRTKLQRHEAQHGKLDLILLDYLQLMQSEEEGKRNENEVIQLSKISRGLKKLAKRFNVPVLVVASLNRASESRANKRLQLSDLRGSGSIEYDSDVVMFISRSPERIGYSLINVEKHRNGPVGDVWLRFNPSITRFETAEEEAHV